jgi:predicted aldo/keto reductase-like oxidoreductase
MKYSKIGKTDVKVSYIAMGGHEYLPNGQSRGFNEDISLASKPGYIFEGFGGENRKQVLRAAFNYGVNFFDVTMDSEKEAIGRNLKELGTPYDIYIQTRPEGMVYTYDEYNIKMADYSLLKAEAQRIIKLLQRDCIDFFNIAFMKSAWEHDPEYFDKMKYNIEKLKKEGLIRFACADTFSGEETYLRQIKSDAYDVIYINYNFGDYKAKENVFPLCREKNMGIITRETFMKGNLFHFAKEANIENKTLVAHAAMKWQLGHNDVNMLVYGSDKPNHVEDAMKLVENLKMTEEEEQIISLIKKTKGYKEFEQKKTKEFLEL